MGGQRDRESQCEIGKHQCETGGETGRKENTQTAMETAQTQPKTNETSACVETPQTITERTIADSKSSKKRLWLDKWIGLETAHHPKLVELENAIHRFCIGVWDDPTVGRTLVLCGANGNGKTHCAAQVRRWIEHVGTSKQLVTTENGRRVVSYLQAVYWFWPHLLDTLKGGGWDAVEGMTKTPVLILDEVAGGHDPSQVGTEKLSQVLSNREKKWNLITTNAAPDAWEAVFDRRIASRLFRNSTVLDLSDVPDYSLVKLGGYQAPYKDA